MLVLKDTNIKNNMNLKKENGYVGIDLTTSIIVLMILIPTIMALIFNLNICNQDTERKGNAINFATSIIEIVKGADFDEIETLTKDKDLYASSQNQSLLGSNINITEEITSDEAIDKTIISNIEDNKGVHYRATLTIQKYIQTIDESNTETEEEPLVKTITVEIEYPLGKEQKKVSLSTVITKY